jgi:hypothetical protein
VTNQNFAIEILSLLADEIFCLEIHCDEQAARAAYTETRWMLFDVMSNLEKGDVR